MRVLVPGGSAPAPGGEMHSRNGICDAMMRNLGHGPACRSDLQRQKARRTRQQLSSARRWPRDDAAGRLAAEVSAPGECAPPRRKVNTLWASEGALRP